MPVSRPLGRRQAEVLRAAAAVRKLIRFDGGGWAADGHACTRPAQSVEHLLVAVQRGAVVTGGSWQSRPGAWMGLTDEGRAALDAYDVAHPEGLVARQQRADAIARMAAKRGPVTGADVLRLAADDPALDDDTFTTLAPAMDGRPHIEETAR